MLKTKARENVPSSLELLTRFVNLKTETAEEKTSTEIPNLLSQFDIH